MKLPLGRGVSVLTLDANGLGALAKPAGVLAHPNAAEADRRSLLTAPYNLEREAYEWDSATGRQGLFLLNRLDSATSGVILVADSAELAASVRELFRTRQIDKTYIARVFGRTAPGPTRWRDRLKIEKTRGSVRSQTGGGVAAESTATVIKAGRSDPITSLLKLEPHTGRSHQLRVQCASRQLPIVGDQTYGDFPRNRDFAKRTGLKRLFLHSLETSFEYEWKGRQYTFSAHAPLPPEFEAGL